MCDRQQVRDSEEDYDQHSAGGLVVRGEEILLIELDGGRRWQLPKGHLEEGESVLDAAHREVLEETGIDGEAIAPIGHLLIRFGGQGGQRIRKRVDYFLFAYKGGTTADYSREEVTGASWFAWDEGIERLTFDNERNLARKGREIWRTSEESRKTDDGQRVLGS